MMTDQCIQCKHYLGALTCKAFDDQIPEDILIGEFDHNKVHPKQSNEDYLFEPITTTEEE